MRWAKNFPDQLGGIFADHTPAFAAMEPGNMAPEYFHMLTDLGHRADRRAGRFHCVALFDSNGWGDALDAINLRLVHPIEELPGVGGKRFDIAPLAFSKKSIKRERAFAGSARASDHNQMVEWEIKIEILQIILPNATQTDGRSSGLS